jgi:hypothetical protein
MDENPYQSPEAEQDRGQANWRSLGNVALLAGVASIAVGLVLVLFANPRTEPKLILTGNVLRALGTILALVGGVLRRFAWTRPADDSATH